MPTTDRDVDVVLVGAGVMSATLATMIRAVQPDWSIEIVERLDAVARESSGPWNNAGTGHTALCEVNYTPELADGTIDTSKAQAVNDQFRLSEELWNHLDDTGEVARSSFSASVPHMTFVRGERDVDFLRRRWEALRVDERFSDIEFTDDPSVVAQWAPMLMAGREAGPVAATRSTSGCDVDFGVLTSAMVDAAVAGGARLRLNHEVTRLRRSADGTWAVRMYDRAGSRRSVTTLHARFVFVGAGGGALTLLQSSRIPEIRGYAGFPISGLFWRSTDPTITERHDAKVYGKAAVGSPPMSVPHLDTRVVDGQRSVMFGPYAGWSMKFLKHGSWLDLIRSIRFSNIVAMAAVGLHNVDLIRYLLREVLAGRRQRLAALREFVPLADAAQWEPVTAGQRVQIIKSDPRVGGVLEFGTEVLTSADGSIAGLLGASPGASTAVSAMLEVLDRCFPEQREQWRPTLERMMPSIANRATSAATAGA